MAISNKINQYSNQEIEENLLNMISKADRNKKS